MTNTVGVGDEFHLTRNPGIVYRVTAMDDHETLLKLIEHPCGVNEDDYFHDSVKNIASGGRYTKVVPFFEVGKKYRYRTNGYEVWTVHSLVEQDGSKAAVVFRREGGKVHWNAFAGFAHFEEVTD